MVQICDSTHEGTRFFLASNQVRSEQGSSQVTCNALAHVLSAQSQGGLGVEQNAQHFTFSLQRLAHLMDMQYHSLDFRLFHKEWLLCLT